MTSHQRTKYTIIAVHTSGKKLLFGRLLKDVLETSTKIDPKFDHLAEKQNNSCEGERVFYKTPEHSEKYYGYWKEQKLTGTTRQVHYSTVSLIELPICEKIFASVHLPLTVPSLPSQGNNKSLLTVPIASIEVVVPEISVLKRTAPNHTYLLNCRNSYYYRIPAQSISVSALISTYKMIQDQDRQTNIATPYHPYSNYMYALKKHAKDVMMLCAIERCVGLTARANSVRVFGIKRDVFNRHSFCMIFTNRLHPFYNRQDSVIRSVAFFFIMFFL